MNIFSKKLEQAADIKLPIDPIDLFQTLFHKEGYGYLRGIQEEVLKSWHQRRDEKELLCKMNTGSGKTLVSLMMLYSKLIEGVNNAVYVCPDRQLLEQAKVQAGLYGIPVCEIIETGNQFPNDFHNSKSILLCTFAKLFNAKSIFERDNISIGAIVIDDAHSCLDIARDKTTLKIPMKSELASRILNLFKDDLIHQAAGSYQRIISGDPFAKILKVPYWSWYNNKNEILAILNEYSTEDFLMFKWGLIADDLMTYDCYVGNNEIEIAPIHVPYHNIRSFCEAQFKYILSATFEDQIDLIKDFGINENSIKNALIPRDRKDIGQRLILAPKRFDPTIPDKDLYRLITEYSKNKVNVIVLVPSKVKAATWISIGAQNLNDGDVNLNIEELKLSNGGLYVLINRYDGIDLIGNMCRLLIIDGYPNFISHKDSYTQLRLESVNASLKAQIIEQGLGRAVRSGSDYCTIYLMGTDLLQFLGYKYNLQFFTSVTRKQLEFGLTLLDDATSNNSLETIREITNYCLDQNQDWRKYHSQKMLEIESENLNEDKIKNLHIAQIEKEAINLFRNRYYQASKDLILNEIINFNNLSNKQKAWYFQFAAQMLFPENKVEANDLQIKATKLAPHMFQPSLGNSYTKISANEEQSSGVLNFINQFDKSQDLKIFIENLLNDLKFSPDIQAIKFENALANVGRLIGFNAQEPENELGNGPDVLWVMTDNHYLVLEAKSMAIHEEITRDNVGQLLQSGEWFKSTYGSTANHTLVTLQSPRIKGYNVNPSENTKVIDEEALNLLRKNLLEFVDSIVSIGIKAITKTQIGRFLGVHYFLPEIFRSKYLKNLIVKRK